MRRKLIQRLQYKESRKRRRIRDDDDNAGQSKGNFLNVRHRVNEKYDAVLQV